MSDNKQAANTGDAGKAASSNAASNSDDVTTSANQEAKSKETVAYETYARTLSKLKKLEDYVEQAEKAKETEKSKLLEEQGQWKSVAEQERKQKADLLAKLQSTEKMISDSSKMSAFLKQIPGSVKEDYWQLINLDEIIVDPDTNKPDAVALETYAKTWMEKHPRLIERSSTAKTPTDAPRVSTTVEKLSIADMAKKLAGLNNKQQ